MRMPIAPAGSAPHDAADRPGDEAQGDVLGPHAEAFRAVQREPRGKRLEGELQQERGGEDGAHARHDAAHGLGRGPCECLEGGGAGVRRRCPRLAKRDRERQSDRKHGARRHEEGGLHPQRAAEHQEHDRAHAHLEGDRAGRERAIARRHEVGQERLEGRALKVDAAEEDQHRPHDAEDAEARRPGEQRHAQRREREAGEHERETPAPARPGSVGHGARPGYQQEQQHVVERHHHADERPLIAERVADERRHEHAQERPGDAGEEAPEADDQAEAVRSARGRRPRRIVREPDRPLRPRAPARNGIHRLVSSWPSSCAGAGGRGPRYVPRAWRLQVRPRRDRRRGA
jgi:hypothetical protein